MNGTAEQTYQQGLHHAAGGKYAKARDAFNEIFETSDYPVEETRITSYAHEALAIVETRLTLGHDPDDSIARKFYLEAAYDEAVRADSWPRDVLWAKRVKDFETADERTTPDDVASETDEVAEDGEAIKREIAEAEERRQQVSRLVANVCVLRALNAHELGDTNLTRSAVARADAVRSNQHMDAQDGASRVVIAHEMLRDLNLLDRAGILVNPGKWLVWKAAVQVDRLLAHAQGGSTAEAAELAHKEWKLKKLDDGSLYESLINGFVLPSPTNYEN